MNPEERNGWTKSVFSVFSLYYSINNEQILHRFGWISKPLSRRHFKGVLNKNDSMIFMKDIKKNKYWNNCPPTLKACIEV